VLVETFDTQAEAESFVSQRLATVPRLFRRTPPGARGLAGPPTRDDWKIDH
jgi:hypothetical protein